MKEMSIVPIDWRLWSVINQNGPFNIIGMVKFSVAYPPLKKGVLVFMPFGGKDVRLQ